MALVPNRKPRSFSPADFVSLSNRSSISERDEFDTDEDECMISSSFISSRCRPQSVFVSSLLVYLRRTTVCRLFAFCFVRFR